MWVHRVAIPIAVVLLVTGVATYLAEQPHPSSCGGGQFSMDNGYVYNGSSYSNASFTTVVFTSGASVNYQWSATSGVGADFYVQYPDGNHVDYPGSNGGAGNFVAESGEYEFGLAAAPPIESVTVTYAEVCSR